MPRQREAPRKGPKPLYPWDRWMSSALKRLVKIRPGRDYSCGSAAMAGQIRSKAYRMGILVSVSEGEDDQGQFVAFRAKRKEDG